MARPKRLGPYAPLSATYASDDAIIEAGEKAELLWCRGIAFCAAAESDGYITEGQLLRNVGAGMHDAKTRANTLVKVGLWERVEGGYVIRGWLKWNKSTEEIGRERRRDRERKATTPHPDPPPQGPPDPPGAPPESHPDSTRNPNGIHPESQRNPSGVPQDSAPAPALGACAGPRTGLALTPARPIHSTPLHTDSLRSSAAAPPSAPTLTQRSKTITNAYADAEPMCRWPAINGIVLKALKAGRWSDNEIRDALLRLATEHRTVTVDTLRIELDGLPTPNRSAAPPVRGNPYLDDLRETTTITPIRHALEAQ